ncbi:MAG: hypothetical protein PVJ07_08785 [Anaerolineales bacterium]|jgi:hypothetical protein
MSEETAKKLKLMRFWLIGAFLIILVADILIALYMPGLMGQLYYWLGLVIAAAVFIIWYFIYKWILSRKQ